MTFKFGQLSSADEPLFTASIYGTAQAAEAAKAEYDRRAGRCALWCLHIHGPDDVHAAPSKAHAERAAELFNKRFAHVTDVLCKAVVCKWPHSDESHAADVGKFCELWLLAAKENGA